MPTAIDYFTRSQPHIIPANAGMFFCVGASSARETPTTIFIVGASSARETPAKISTVGVSSTRPNPATISTI